jgi:hypothetical protein
MWCLCSGADCNRFQFECVNKEEPSLAECIAVYDRCNGIAQCRDESDERQCNDQQQSLQQSDVYRQPGEKPAVDQEMIDVHRTQSVLNNSTNSAQGRVVSAALNDRKTFQAETGDGAGVYDRDNYGSQPVSQTSYNLMGGSRLSPKNGYGHSFAGQGRDTGKLTEQSDNSESRNAQGFRKPVLQAEKYPVYQSRPSDQLGQKIGESEDSTQVGRTVGQSFERGRSQTDGLFLSEQPVKDMDSFMSKQKAKTVDQSREKQGQRELTNTKFASARGSIGLETDLSSVNYEDSHGNEPLTDVDRLKAARTAKLGGETVSDGQPNSDERYQLKGLPSTMVSTKTDDVAGSVGMLSHGDYAVSGGKNEKQTGRFVDKNSVDDPLATTDDGESHHFGILHHDNLNSRFSEKHLDYNKDIKHVSSDSVSDAALSSDLQYGKLRGTSVTETLAGSKFANAKMRTSESKPSDDLMESSKSVVHNADQNQWAGGDKYQQTGSPDYGSDRFRPYVDVESKSSREKDNLKSSKLHGADMPSRSELSDSVLKPHIRPLHQAQVEDPSAYVGQDKEIEHYQDNGDLLLRGKPGRFRQLDRNDRPVDLSLDRYSANLAAGGDRSGQLYNYGGHYNDEDTVGNRFIDGQTDPASPYDGVHLPGDGTGQPVSRGQFYGYGHDAYGDNAYNSEDYYYGMMARPSSHGYGHAMGSVPDYDYYSATDGGTGSLMFTSNCMQIVGLLLMICE